MRMKFVLTSLLVFCLALAASPAYTQDPGAAKKGGARPAKAAKGGKKGKGKKEGGAPAAAPVAAAPGADSAAAPAATDELGSFARDVVGALQKQAFKDLFGFMDPTMQQAIGSPEKLGEIWTGLQAQCGPFKKVGNIRSAKFQQYEVRFVTTEFEKVKLEAMVAFSPDKKISGLRFLPVQAAQTPLASDAANVNSVAVTVGSAPWELPGTLTLPKGKGPFPAVVLVHGSGPQDRDETVGANKPFRDLAEGLSAKGVAVLRYEKRTKQHALACAGADKPITVKEETIDDALAAVDLLKQNNKIDPKRIFVAGHSLGGMLIPRIAEGAPDLAGLIVLAGSARPLEDVALEQVNYLASLEANQNPETQKNLEEVKKQVMLVKNLQPGAPKTALFILGAPPEYWFALRGYQPAETAKAITRPLLVMQGGRDYQVTQDDFKLWQAALAGKSNATFKLYPELNHLFIAGEGKSTPAEYEKAGRVASAVIDDIAAWVNQVK